MRWSARFAKIAIGVGVAGLVLGFLSGIGALAYFAESFPSWTGFGLVPEYDAQREVAGYAPAKTLWDWLNLLLVPLVLTGGGIWFTREENRQAREIEQNRVMENRKIEEERLKEARELERERSEDALIKDYLDQMTDLLLNHSLRISAEGAEVRSVARARTLTVLRGVDEIRKGTIVEFLYEARLINYFFNGEKTVAAVVQLREADIRRAGLGWAKLEEVDLAGSILTEINLEGANLRRAELGGVSLRRAELGWADLEGANLRRTDLEGANLRRTNLRRAELTRADLEGADLSGADLSGAELGWANLRGTELEGAELRVSDLSGVKGLTLDQLRQAKSLHGTILPDYINPADLGDLWSPPKPEDTPELRP